MSIKRIMIIGGPGSGKSTLARVLGAQLALPVIHLDALFWRPGWVQSDRDVFNDRVRRVIAEDAWIIEGNYSATWPERTARADRIVFLDVSRPVRMLRILRRTFVNYGKSRTDLGDECPERFDAAFFRYAMDYDRDRRPAANALCADTKLQSKVIVARDAKHVVRAFQSVT